jgi:hypothetical protein
VKSRRQSKLAPCSKTPVQEVQPPPVPYSLASPCQSNERLLKIIPPVTVSSSHSQSPSTDSSSADEGCHFFRNINFKSLLVYYCLYICTFVLHFSHKLGRYAHTVIMALCLPVHSVPGCTYASCYSIGNSSWRF